MKMTLGGRGIGPERVTNGVFDADTDWTKGLVWTIAGGVASIDGSQAATSQLYQNSVVDHTNESLLYKVTFDVTRSAGSWAVYLCNGGWANPVSTTSWQTITGSLVYYLSPYSTGAINGRVLIAANSSFIGTFDNISVKQYL